MVHPVVILVIGVVVGTALIHMSARIAGVEELPY